MDRIQIKMRRTKGQLVAGRFYNLPENIARDLMARGYAALPEPWPVREAKPAGPSESKPIAPSEVKVKKNSQRGPTAKEY